MNDIERIGPSDEELYGPRHRPRMSVEDAMNYLAKWGKADSRAAELYSAFEPLRRDREALRKVREEMLKLTPDFEYGDYIGNLNVKLLKEWLAALDSILAEDGDASVAE